MMHRIIHSGFVHAIGLLALLTVTSPVLAEAVKVVAFSQDDMTNDWRHQQVMDVRKHLAHREDIQFIHRDAGGNTAVQMQQIKQLIADKVDVLIASPRESRGLSEVIREAHQAGIPVVLLGRKIDYDTYTSFISPDNQAIAQEAAGYLNQTLPEGAKIFMLSGVAGNSVTRARTRAFLDTLNPDFKVIERRGDFIRSRALVATDQLLESGERFAAIYAHSDSMAIGARLALQKHGIDPADLVIVGIDYIQPAREALLAGQQSVSYTYPTGGKQGAAIVEKILGGHPVPKHVTIEHQMVTPELANQVEPIF
ncbi:MAG: substrate-binding domain-containing protein [Hydrogenovibrio sp.]|uniref:substrate-binding domain-containing protein n=1 Tax=Hydrogenovibrio sp. TaxID=2065821 RepID=UPI002870AEA8|nr:substrate-binding domain-containing protein [Hydrogenovibrio sp.]MDR9498045.1 substrate-binding domain-containing protein [Hydrogenovibrio sp.]